jgi:hypothetical protein
MIWFTKKPAHAELPPPIASLQEHNNTPADSIAQSDALQPSTSPPTPEPEPQAVQATNLLEQATQGLKPHRLHSIRKEAMDAVGLPDIAPPHCNPPRVNAKKMAQSLRERMQALEDDNTLNKHRFELEFDYDAHVARMNRAAEINAALAAQKSRQGSYDDHSEDELIELLERGYLQTEIARMWNVTPSSMIVYINETPERRARALIAKQAGGEAMDAKAYELIVTAPPGQEMKRREMASHIRWRLSKIAPDYQDKQRLTVDGGLTIQHEVPERPAIQDMVQAALQAVTPKPRLTDIESED